MRNIAEVARHRVCTNTLLSGTNATIFCTKVIAVCTNELAVAPETRLSAVRLIQRQFIVSMPDHRDCGSVMKAVISARWTPASRAGHLLPNAYRLLAAPVAIGFTIGWVGVDNQNRLASACVWSFFWLSNWLLNELVTRLLAPEMHQRQFSLTVVLATGFSVTASFNVLLNILFGWIFRQWSVQYEWLEALATMTPAHMISSAIAPLFFWLAINIVACRMSDGKLFGLSWVSMPVRKQPNETISNLRIGRPAFMDKVKPSLRGKVIAVNAELHYVRVYTSLGDDLIYYRFRDAVSDMVASGGVQIHRSWCIAGDEIDCANAGSITLSNGLKIRIGPTFRKRLNRQQLLSLPK